MRMQTFAVLELFKGCLWISVAKNLEVPLSSAIGWELNWLTESGGYRSSDLHLSGRREALRIILTSLKAPYPKFHILKLTSPPRRTSNKNIIKTS